MTDKPTTLIVCVNRRFQSDKGSCADKGSEALADVLEHGIRKRNIDITLERIRCLGECGNGPSMRLAPGGKFFLKVESDNIAGILVELEALCGKRSYHKIEAPPQYWPGS